MSRPAQQCFPTNPGNPVSDKPGLDNQVLKVGNSMNVNEVETKIVEMKMEGKINGVRTSQAAVVKSEPQSWNLSLRFFRDEAEMQAISSALSKTGWNRKRAAQLLSISYRGLLYKIRRHNIAPPTAQAVAVQEGAERS
jgi:transcriptional regulator with GAF, ATPase, and Fis domain